MTVEHRTGLSYCDASSHLTLNLLREAFRDIHNYKVSKPEIPEFRWLSQDALKKHHSEIKLLENINERIKHIWKITHDSFKRKLPTTF